MTYKMFIDDERDPPNDGTAWVVCRSYHDVFWRIDFEGFPSFISFDHDLGDDLTGYDIAKEIVNLDIDFDGNQIPDDFSFYVHSQNPVGAENIRQYLNGYLGCKGG